MIRRPPRSTQSRSSAASDVYKRQTPYAKGYWPSNLGYPSRCTVAVECNASEAMVKAKLEEMELPMEMTYAAIQDYYTGTAGWLLGTNQSTHCPTLATGIMEDPIMKKLAETKSIQIECVFKPIRNRSKGPVDIEQRAKAVHIITKSEHRTSVAEALRNCLLYTSPSPRDKRQSRMPSSA